MTRPSRIAVMVRVLVALAALLLPMVTAHAWILLTAVTVTVVLYDGIRSGTVYGMFALLLCAEVIYGVDAGVLTVSFLLVTACLLAIRRVIALPAWSSHRGWRPADAFLFISIATLIALGTLAVQVAVQHLLYATGVPLVRLAMVVTLPHALWVLAGVSIVAVAVRRADVPFRRPVIFGSS